MMTANTADHTIVVFIPGWVFDDGGLTPPACGDLIDVELTFHPDGHACSPLGQTMRATVRPIFGHAPSGRPDGPLHWPLEVLGDGWCAAWISDRPLAGQVEFTGMLIAGSSRAGYADPAQTRGRVRRVRLVEQRCEPTGRGMRLVAGTERLTEIEATPHRNWSDPHMPPAEAPFRKTGVLVDLDTHDVPLTTSGFVAGAVSVDGPDVWVMDRSNPILLHLDTRSTPPRVVEYLVPLTIEPPIDQWTRRVHADRDGCWITSRCEVFRCDRASDGTLTVERVSAEGGNTVLAGGRLFIVGCMHPTLRDDPRYGTVRDDGDAHRLRVLDDERRFVPVEDPDTIADVTPQLHRADSARGADGTEWIAVGTLTAVRPDGTRRRIALDPRARGPVHWIQPDPLADPANADIVAAISVPPLGHAEPGIAPER